MKQVIAAQYDVADVSHGVTFIVATGEMVQAVDVNGAPVFEEDGEAPVLIPETYHVHYGQPAFAGKNGLIATPQDVGEVEEWVERCRRELELLLVSP